MQWLFIGAGNMASSLIGGLLAANASADSVVVVDPDSQACQRAKDAFAIRSGPSVDDVMPALLSHMADEGSQLGIVIAVKPHIVESVCISLKACLQRTPGHQSGVAAPLYVSVAAGVRAQSIQSWLPEGACIVRCMPNTPALLGLGITALYANSQCTVENREQAQTLLRSAGTTLWVEQESSLDAVTAVSGSGPAYFFYLIEHMIDAGVELGLTREVAETLAIETAYGAASMARQRQHTPAVLRENVTSKGGTTAAALQVFNDGDTPQIIHAALAASKARAEQLGDDFAS